MEEAKPAKILCASAWLDSMPEYSSDDSDDSDDPSFSILEETHAKFFNLSLDKKAQARVVQENDDEREVTEVDEKSFDEVQRLIGAAQIEKLKVEQCKIYLRKSGLRLTGNKATLIQRIKEHLEIVNGGGEEKYPVWSFVMNCKGDACTGDVVLFEQNVYDMYSIASRSATGPPCGTRMVAGRIVKESYGAAKQQHTFTIEVLWSKGEKPLPPLHPLLIKGRNLYRLKTLRQRWANEGERRKILMEKHSRGFHARSDREARIQEKETRKVLKANRISNKETNGNRNQSRFDSNSVPKPPSQPHSRNPETQATRPQQSRFSSNPTTTQTHQACSAANTGKMATQTQAQNPGSSVNYDKMTMEHNRAKYTYIGLPTRNLVTNPINQPDSYSRGVNLYSHEHLNGTKMELQERASHREPFTSMNNFHHMDRSREYRRAQEICWHYARGGTCHYGERCKFSHSIPEECGQRRE